MIIPRYYIRCVAGSVEANTAPSSREPICSDTNRALALTCTTVAESSNAVSNLVHLALNAEIIEDTTNTIVRTDVLFSLDRKSTFLLSPLYLPVVDRHLCRGKHDITLAVLDLRDDSRLEFVLHDRDRFLVRRAVTPLTAII